MFEAETHNATPFWKKFQIIEKNEKDNRIATSR